MTRPYQCKSQNILMRKKRRLMGEENNSAENFIICTYRKKFQATRKGLSLKIMFPL